MNAQFEEMSKQDLADTLREFYPSARQSSNAGGGDNVGKPYAKQSLINIRSAINHHFQLPPHNKTWDLMNDKEFLSANKVFKGNLRDQKEQGLDQSRSNKRAHTADL